MVLLQCLLSDVSFVFSSKHRRYKVQYCEPKVLPIYYLLAYLGFVP